MLGLAVARAARRHGATLIHAHHYSPFVYAAIASLRPPALPVVFTEHGRLSDAGPSPRRRAANWLLSKTSGRVFAVSEDLKRHLVAEGFPDRQVGVIYNGIELGSTPSADVRARFRQMLGVADDVLVVGTLARLDPVKDLGVLIEAASHLASERRVRVAIVGDGPELATLRQAAARRGISQEVTFLGHQENAREWLSALDVFVNCSTSEGVSLTILEAMAAERAVVATAVGGTPEVVDDSCGRLVPARSPVAVAAAVRALAPAVELRATLGEAARRRVAERFTIDRMVNEYASVYNSLSSSG
jgi:glycosyltransferase involved in cell wall biosynthesis